MDNAKKAEFARRFGKRLHLKRGGMVPHYDAGGTILGGPGSGGVNTGQGLVQNASNLLGTNAQAANVQNGTNAAQLNNAYNQAQTGINAQANLTNTLTPQAATAVGNQNTLAAQELAMSQGRGPNPAANQLAQATGANVANQASLMAGQRGASANPALVARQAAQAGAGIQQNAAGQAATMGAEQQIAAQNNLANLSGAQIGQTGQAVTGLNTAAQNEQNTLENANTAANNANVQMQSNMNNANANTNQGIMGGLAKMSGNIPVVGKLFGGAEGGEVPPGGFHHGPKKLEFIHKMAKMGLEHFEGGGTVSGSASDLAKGIASTAQGGGNQDISHNPLASVFKADGGQIQPNPMIPGIQPMAPAQSWGEQYNPIAPLANLSVEDQALRSPSDMGVQNHSDPMKSQNDNISKESNAMLKGSNIIQNNSAGQGSGQMSGQLYNPGLAAAYQGGEIKNHFHNYFSGGMASGGKVPAMVSPGEVYLNPEQVRAVQGGEDPLKIGHKFQGQAKVKGDSLKNDFIPADLDAGGVVIDREHVMNQDKAKLFVLKSIAKKKVRK